MLKPSYRTDSLIFRSANNKAKTSVQQKCTILHKLFYTLCNYSCYADIICVHSVVKKWFSDINTILKIPKRWCSMYFISHDPGAAVIWSEGVFIQGHCLSKNTLFCSLIIAKHRSHIKLFRPITMSQWKKLIKMILSSLLSHCGHIPKENKSTLLV